MNRELYMINHEPQKSWIDRKPYTLDRARDPHFGGVLRPPGPQPQGPKRPGQTGQISWSNFFFLSKVSRSMGCGEYGVYGGGVRGGRPDVDIEMGGGVGVCLGLQVPNPTYKSSATRSRASSPTFSPRLTDQRRVCTGTRT